MSRIRRQVDVFVRALHVRFAHYVSPRSGRRLDATMKREIENMASLLAQSYAAILEAERDVDRRLAETTAQNQSLVQQVTQLTEINGRQSAEIDRLSQQQPAEPGTGPATPSEPHDGGFITTPKGRQFGSDADRQTLDAIVDRVYPDVINAADLPAAPAEPS